MFNKFDEFDKHSSIFKLIKCLQFPRVKCVTEINNYKTFTKQKKSDIIEEWKE